MNIAVIGFEEQLNEFRSLSLKEGVQAKYLDYISDILESGDHLYVYDFNAYELVIHLNLDQFPEDLEILEAAGAPAVLGCAVSQSLAQMATIGVMIPLFGLNALPTFLSRGRWEMSLYDEEDRDLLDELMEALGLEYDVVEDRAGMVTPRVICMIINEACYVVQEGTSDMAGVDQAMKLGTNYPYGPFEWGDMIGASRVYEVLRGMFEATGDSHFKVSPMLHNLAMKDGMFHAPQGELDGPHMA